MPTQADFLNNPWTFLENHLVTMGMEGYGSAGVKWFRLEEQPLTKAYQVSSILRRKSRVFALKGHLAGATGGFFQAYWCPYEREETKFAVIGSAHRFCFTATITGCSIGLGHETPTGDKLIIHSNHGSTPNPNMTVGQTQAQDIAAIGGAALDKVFGPSSYRTNSKGRGKYTGTVVGWRQNNVWDFKTQRYEELPQLAPKKYMLKDLVNM